MRKERDLDLGDGTGSEGGMSLWHVQARVYCESLEEGRKEEEEAYYDTSLGRGPGIGGHGTGAWSMAVVVVIRRGGSSRKR